MGTHDDEQGVLQTMALGPDRSHRIHMVASTPMMIATLNSILLGAIVSLLAIQLGTPDLGALAIGAAAFVLGWALHTWYARRAIARVRRHYKTTLSDTVRAERPVAERRFRAFSGVWTPFGPERLTRKLRGGECSG